MSSEEIKRAKVEWYSRKECVENYYLDRFSTPLGRYWDAMEQKIVLKHVRGSVLDCGTGPGRFAIPIADKGHETVGIDISTEMLAFAKENSIGKDIQYVRADLESLPFKDNTFDCVLAIHVLRHLPQYKQLLKEFSRVLKPGGCIIFEMISGDYINCAARIDKLVGKRTKKESEEFPRDYATKLAFGELKRTLKELGITVSCRYAYTILYSFVISNPIIQGRKIFSKLLANRCFFKLFCYLEFHVLRYLPTYLAPHYMIIGRKGLE